MESTQRRALRAGRDLVYRALLLAIVPVNLVLAMLRRSAFERGTVLHVSHMVHIAWHTVELLRERGVRATYLAVGRSDWWDRCDVRFTPSRWPMVRVLQELSLFWGFVSRFEVIHLHFMMTPSMTAWEVALLRRMGRVVVAHWRGCEARDSKVLRAREPHGLCEECDYQGRICRDNAHRRRIANRHASLALATTPDLLDFQPSARHLPFFTPSSPEGASLPPVGPPFKIVHATNHPGLEGTRHIERAIERLVADGISIRFVSLRAVTPERVAEELADAHLSIGKMKMGYYANAQIESLAAGVPAITWVRQELRTPAIDDSGLIVCSLDELEKTLRFYLTHPDALEDKRRRARASVRGLHDNDAIVRQLIDLYNAAGAHVPAPRQAPVR